LGANVTVDVRELLAVMRRALDQSSTLSDPFVAKLLEEGDLLPGWYDDWVLMERERLRQLRLHALEALCSRLADAGRFGLAVEVGLAAVWADPLRESAHRALMKAYLAEGNSGEALRQYLNCRRLLHEELGLYPSAQMEDLIRSLGIK
jgi:DNA-binding SARP family transcriptional activator